MRRLIVSKFSEENHIRLNMSTCTHVRAAVFKKWKNLLSLCACHICTIPVAAMAPELEKAFYFNFSFLPCSLQFGLFGFLFMCLLHVFQNADICVHTHKAHTYAVPRGIYVYSTAPQLHICITVRTHMYGGFMSKHLTQTTGKRHLYLFSLPISRKSAKREQEKKRNGPHQRMLATVRIAT